MDAAEADSLYRLLELEVVPTFYDRDRHDVPKRWLRIVKEAIRTVMPRFSARRMMKQYAEEMYESAACWGGSELAPQKTTEKGLS